MYSSSQVTLCMCVSLIEGQKTESFFKIEHCVPDPKPPCWPLEKIYVPCFLQKVAKVSQTNFFWSASGWRKGVLSQTGHFWPLQVECLCSFLPLPRWFHHHRPGPWSIANMPVSYLCFLARCCGWICQPIANNIVPEKRIPLVDAKAGWLLRSFKGVCMSSRYHANHLIRRNAPQREV